MCKEISKCIQTYVYAHNFPMYLLYIIFSTSMKYFYTLNNFSNPRTWIIRISYRYSIYILISIRYILSRIYNALKIQNINIRKLLLILKTLKTILKKVFISGHAYKAKNMKKNKKIKIKKSKVFYQLFYFEYESIFIYYYILSIVHAFLYIMFNADV